MMTPDIQTIFFDVGNTLRIVLKEQDFIDKAEAGLMELIQTQESHDELFAKLEERWKKYRKMSKTTLLDVSEGELWTQYMLPEYDPNMVYANAPRLTRLWRDHDGRRVARPASRPPSSPPRSGCASPTPPSIIWPAAASAPPRPTAPMWATTRCGMWKALRPPASV